MIPPSSRLLFLPVVLLLSSCLPEERVWWSPQGDRALVSISDTLHLVKADRELGEPLTGGLSLKNSLVKTVSWLPDGQRFVCQLDRKYRTWTEARALIPQEESAAVERMATIVQPLLQAAAKLAEDAESLDDVVSALPMQDSRRFSAALLLAYQTEPDAVEKLLLALPDGKKIVDSLKGQDAGFQVGELCLVRLDAGKVVETKPWHRRLLTPVVLPKVSPRHEVVACLTLDEKEETVALHVLPLGGGPGFVVSQNVSSAFEWMPDGRTLVFMASIGGKDEALRSIHRITVVAEDGTLMIPQEGEQRPGSQSHPVTLATGIMLSRPVLQVLPDGRVLFASQPASLPLAGAVSELTPRLYVIAADGKSVQPVPTSPGDLPADLGYFVASPDGRLVAVVESETDAVAVVEVDSGRTHIISQPHPRWHCRTIPAWKSATELSFAALHGPADEPKWMLWTEGVGIRCISEKWPATATAKWLEQKSEDASREPAITRPAYNP